MIGNIALRLKETDSPVDIPTGTRNLTLRRRLDKEGREGPSSVYVNVICDRLHTSDPVSEDRIFVSNFGSTVVPILFQLIGFML